MGQLARWIEVIDRYHITFQHRPAGSTGIQTHSGAIRVGESVREGPPPGDQSSDEKPHM